MFSQLSRLLLGLLSLTGVFSMVLAVDVIPPVFSHINFTSDNAKNPNIYAKVGDKVRINIVLGTGDTRRSSYNKLTFSLGNATNLRTRNYLGATNPKDQGYRTYTILSGQNGSFVFTDLQFEDKSNNAIVNFVAPYTPVANVIVDTTIPVISFVDDISSGSTSVEVVELSIVDENPDISTYRYGFSTDSTCDTNDSYNESFVSGIPFSVDPLVYSGSYLCAQAEDMAGNMSYRSSAYPFSVFSNDSPTDILLSGSSVLENNLVDALIGIFSSIDVNTGDIHTYSLVAGSGDLDNHLFSLGSDGTLRIQEISDFEVRTGYSIRVSSNDAHGGIFEKVFAIEILDVADVNVPHPGGLSGSTAPISLPSTGASSSMSFSVPSLIISFLSTYLSFFLFLK